MDDKLQSSSYTTMESTTSNSALLPFPTTMFATQVSSKHSKNQQLLAKLLPNLNTGSNSRKTNLLILYINRRSPPIPDESDRRTESLHTSHFTIRGRCGRWK